MSTEVINQMNNWKTSVSTTGTTDRGTKIVKESGGSMDKNAFFKLLAAELSHLDPSQNQDSSAYVTQMAQFASMEQMTNLNSTMTKSSYQQLIGKGAVMNDKDSKGSYITGIVQGVTTDASNVTWLDLQVLEKGSVTNKSYKADNLQSVQDPGTNSAISNTNTNVDFLTASALKGQDVVISTTDGDNKSVEVTGTVKSVYIDNATVMLRVTDKAGTTKEYPYSSVLKAGDLKSSSTST
jgi:flagellar basal-body rod modification protein FlgD